MLPSLQVMHIPVANSQAVWSGFEKCYIQLTIQNVTRSPQNVHVKFIALHHAVSCRVTLPVKSAR
jgi:hypothetical protein